MKMKIYGYNNRAKEIELPDDRQVCFINVVVLSGDETGVVYFTNGDKIEFDACNSRCISLYDGCYSVVGDDIQRWLNWEPEAIYTMYSYNRQADFPHA